jgi:hypothetical protein
MGDRPQERSLAWTITLVALNVATVLAVGWLLASRASVTSAVIFLLLGVALLYGNMRAAEFTRRFTEEWRGRRRDDPPAPRLGDPGSDN